MINYPHDIWNHRVGFGRRGPGFEVICLRLDVPLYWWFIWFITMKCIEMIHLYLKTWWEECFTTDDAGISFVSNTSKTFTNTLLSCAKSCNNWLYILCIIVGGRWRDEMMEALTWSGKFCWRSNHLYITIYAMNLSSCIDSRFSFVVK